MTMPISGDHICNERGARRSIKAMTAKVTTAARGAAIGDTDLPGGTSVSIPNTARITVAAISMSTVPDTTGVIMRRNNESRAATKNFSTDDRTTSVAIITGPPCIRAVMQMAIAGSAVPITRICPVPKRPNLRELKIVATPQTINEANTAHLRYSCGSPAVRTIITTGTTTNAIINYR